MRLRHLESWTEARRARASAYGRALKDTGIELTDEQIETIAGVCRASATVPARS